MPFGLIALYALLIVAMPALSAEAPLVIAHRGASGYVPEHTLLSVTMAHAMGADYIEQDIVLSADDVPVVLHDIHLETTTDVVSRFPDRAREDGRWYAIDFTLAELQQLSVTERRAEDQRPVFPGRFPQRHIGLRIPTLAGEISLIDGLNQSRGREAGLYIEFKAPKFHAQHGKDIVAAVLNVLSEAGLNEPTSRVFLQCFDPVTLASLRKSGRTELPLIQLIGANDWDADDPVDYDAMRTAAGLKAIAAYADGIGPWIPQLFSHTADNPSLVEAAHAEGLAVHPYTLRKDAPDSNTTDFGALQYRVFIEAGADGAFTDFPDLTRAFIDDHFQAGGGEPSPHQTRSADFDDQ